MTRSSFSTGRLSFLELCYTHTHTPSFRSRNERAVRTACICPGLTVSEARASSSRRPTLDHDAADLVVHSRGRTPALLLLSGAAEVWMRQMSLVMDIRGQKGVSPVPVVLLLQLDLQSGISPLIWTTRASQQLWLICCFSALTLEKANSHSNFTHGLRDLVHDGCDGSERGLGDVEDVARDGRRLHHQQQEFV